MKCNYGIVFRSASDQTRNGPIRLKWRAADSFSRSPRPLRGERAKAEREESDDREEEAAAEEVINVNFGPSSEHCWSSAKRYLTEYSLRGKRAARCEGRTAHTFHTEAS